MDLLQDVTYRGFKLNDSSIQTNLTPSDVAGGGITGCVIDSVDFSDVDVVQYLEKRSQSDGSDAGDVFLGVRRVRMSGTLYALTRALLFDALRSLRAALNPILAQADSPADLGYQPLYFAMPTNDLTNFTSPAGVIEMQMKALPRAFQAIIVRDDLGGSDEDALAIQWQATFVCRDPGILGLDPQDTVITPGIHLTQTGNVINRGNYLAPAEMLIVTTSAAGVITCTIGDSVFTITVPASAGARIIRMKGKDKVLTVEENSVENLRMDLITFTGASTWPLISPGTSAYSISVASATTSATSHFWFYEQYA
jgi:hypothetical protein